MNFKKQFNKTCSSRYLNIWFWYLKKKLFRGFYSAHQNFWTYTQWQGYILPYFNPSVLLFQTSTTRHWTDGESKIYEILLVQPPSSSEILLVQPPSSSEILLVQPPSSSSFDFTHKYERNKVVRVTLLLMSSSIWRVIL